MTCIFYLVVLLLSLVFGLLSILVTKGLRFSLPQPWHDGLYPLTRSQNRFFFPPVNFCQVLSSSETDSITGHPGVTIGMIPAEHTWDIFYLLFVLPSDLGYCF